MNLWCNHKLLEVADFCVIEKTNMIPNSCLCFNSRMHMYTFCLWMPQSGDLFCKFVSRRIFQHTPIIAPTHLNTFFEMSRSYGRSTVRIRDTNKPCTLKQRWITKLPNYYSIITKLLFYCWLHALQSETITFYT